MEMVSAGKRGFRPGVVAILYIDCRGGEVSACAAVGRRGGGLATIMKSTALPITPHLAGTVMRMVWLSDLPNGSLAERVWRR